MEYGEEDVEQLEREIENVMRRSNMGGESGMLGTDDARTVNMTVVHESFAS